MTFLARHNQERCVELERKDRLAYYVKCQSKGDKGGGGGVRGEGYGERSPWEMIVRVEGRQRFF